MPPRFMKTDKNIMNEIHLNNFIANTTRKLVKKYRPNSNPIIIDKNFSKILYLEIINIVSNAIIGSLVINDKMTDKISNRIFAKAYDLLVKDNEPVIKPVKKSYQEIKKMSLNELENYMFSFRKYKYHNNIKENRTNLILRKLFNKPLVKFPLLIERIFNKEQLDIYNRIYKINDDYTVCKKNFIDKIKFDLESNFLSNGKPIIYVVSHIGDNDIQRAFNAIPRASYLFIGDPMDIYRDINGVLLKINGSCEFEIRNKEDRKIVKDRTEHILRLTPSKKLPKFLQTLMMPNLIIFPEGVWNLDDSLPMLNIYEGAIKIAVNTNSDIVPVCLDLYDKKSLEKENSSLVDISLDFKNDKSYMVNFGEIISLKENCNIKEETHKLRNTMATLKYYMWEEIYKDKLISRDSITDDYIENFAQKKLDLCPYFYIKEQIEETKFHNGNSSFDEAFSFMHNIIPNKNNIFLYKDNRFLRKIKKRIRK